MGHSGSAPSRSRCRNYPFERLIAIPIAHFSPEHAWTRQRTLTVEQRRGEVHADGQIWSQALWEIRRGYEALRLGTRAWDTTLVDSQFDYAPDTSFSAAARATYNKALTRDGTKAANLVRERFAARHITF